LEKFKRKWALNVIDSNRMLPGNNSGSLTTSIRQRMSASPSFLPMPVPVLSLVVLGKREVVSVAEGFEDGSEFGDGSDKGSGSGESRE
jgi:hypothetical protein